MPDGEIIEAASSKMLRAASLIEQAEAVLNSVTENDLIRGDYVELDADRSAIHMVYRVVANATALRVVREHLSLEFLS